MGNGTLKQQALEYEKAHEQVKYYDEFKKLERHKVGESLNEMGADKYDLTDTVNEEGKILRTQKIIKKSIQYDNDKLMKLLKDKGKEAFKRAVVLSVDQSVLDDLYNEGVLTYDELNGCVDKVKQTSTIDIRRVKADLKGELKNDDGKFRFTPKG